MATFKLEYSKYRHKQSKKVRKKKQDLRNLKVPVKIKTQRRPLKKEIVLTKKMKLKSAKQMRLEDLK